MYKHREEEEPVLQKDVRNGVYDFLVKEAVRSGRVGGKYRCGVCGMRYHTEEEASECCPQVVSRTI